MFTWLRRRRLRQRLIEARLEREAKKTEERGLLTALMGLENTRLEQQVRMDQARAELELKRVQWEIENAEAVQKSKEADIRLAQEMRERRKEANQKAREAKAAYRQAARDNQSTNECRVCKGGFTDLTTEEITWHYRGHTYGKSLFDN